MGLFDIFKKKKNNVDEENEIIEDGQETQDSAEVSDKNPDNTDSDIINDEIDEPSEIFSTDDIQPLESEKPLETEEIEEQSPISEKDVTEESAEPAISDNIEEAEIIADNITAVQEEEKNEGEKLGFFGRLKRGLKKTREDFGGKMAGVFTFGRKIDEEFYEDLEETLIQSDVGVRTAMELTDRLRERQKTEKIKDTAVLQKALEEEIENILLAKDEAENRIKIEDNKLNIILVVGVNGAGKTTTIGKMAYYYKSCGKKVLLAAADTFRAAAIEQLCEWGKRVDVAVIRHNDGADPGAVVFDACQAAKSRKTDVLIVDTAGRLQNKKNLMEELKKIDKIINREAEGANVECLLVLDSGTGQNAISQAKLFGEVVPLTGIILTKLDGTAKGGVVIGITNELNLPVKMIGVGESLEDLREFVPADFAKALFEDDTEEASNYDPLQETKD